MYVRDALGSLARRWYVTAGGLLLTAGLLVVALQLVPPSWQSKASVVLLPPKSALEPGGNPYLGLGGLSPTLDLVEATMTDQQMIEQIKSISSGAEFTVEGDANSSGPVLLIVVEDSDPRTATAVRDALLSEVPRKLGALQDSLNVPRTARITSMTLTQDASAELAGRNQIRAAVVAVGAGLVGTLFVARLVDTLALGRRRRSDPEGSVATDSSLSREWDEPPLPAVVVRAERELRAPRRPTGRPQQPVSSWSVPAPLGRGQGDPAGGEERGGGPEGGDRDGAAARNGRSAGNGKSPDWSW